MNIMRAGVVIYSSDGTPVGTTITDGQNAAVGTSGAAIASSASCTYAIIQADQANTQNVKVGSSSSQNLVLTPGQIVIYPVKNIATLYAKSVSGTQTINYNLVN